MIRRALCPRRRADCPTHRPCGGRPPGPARTPARSGPTYLSADHLLGDPSRVIQTALGSRGRHLEHERLGGSAAEGANGAAAQMVEVVPVAVLLGRWELWSWRISRRYLAQRFASGSRSRLERPGGVSAGTLAMLVRRRRKLHRANEVSRRAGRPVARSVHRDLISARHSLPGCSGQQRAVDYCSTENSSMTARPNSSQLPIACPADDTPRNGAECVAALRRASYRGIEEPDED
jgi:hypothetical protein